MPHISSQTLPKQTLEQVYKTLFVTTTSRLTSRTKQEKFFDELLTPTEKIMLGKRLAAIALLSRDHSSYAVSQLLQLSPNTAKKLQYGIERGRFAHIKEVSALHGKSKMIRLLEHLLEPLPRYGTSPASWLRSKMK